MTARTITHAGVTLTVSEWAKRIGQSPQFIHARLSHGWTVEEALTLPKGKRVSRPIPNELETEFHKLVCSIDGALRVYRMRVGSLMLEEIDRGVGQHFAKSRRDRCPRVTQDRA